MTRATQHATLQPAASCAETIRTYDAVAAEYAQTWFDLPVDDLLCRLVERLPPGAAVLDAGCGPARDTLWLAQQGFRAVGIDLSWGMLRQGQMRLAAQGVVAPLIQADMACLPFCTASFQGVWACASLLHIPKAQAGQVLGEFARVVRPGYLYLSVKRGHGEGWVADQAGRRRFFAHYRPGELERLVERSGFEVLESWENADRLGRRQRWLNVLARTKMT